MKISQINRRNFLKVSALTGVGLMLEMTLPSALVALELVILIGSI